MSDQVTIKPPVNFLLVGVGGQGTILASDILAEVGLKLGFDAKKAEIHGMSQRGGSVTSNLRWADQVFSPIVAKGQADFLIAFEKLEAARFSDYLRPGGTALVMDTQITPVTVQAAGGPAYPGDDQITAALARTGASIHWIKATEIAEKLGNAKAANVVMIGALTRMIGLSPQLVQEAVDARVPAKHRELNRQAFQAGWEAFE